MTKELQNIFTENGLTLSTAESCTGGNIAKQITKVSGSSKYFIGGLVAYHASVKEEVLGVGAEDILSHGVVSETVASQMAQGVRKLMASDYGVSTTGVAGPTGGTEESPVGTVWISVAKPDGVVSKKFHFDGERKSVTKQASSRAIKFLIKELKKDLRLSK